MGDSIFFIHQKSLFELDLFIYNRNSKFFKKIFSDNAICPANFRLLPDLKGFSFIDKGRIRLKYFDKPKIQSIELYEPINEIGTIEWIDNHNCCFSAKKDKRLAIFNLNIQNQKVDCIKSNDISDCIFPQKIQNALFYIERTKDESYRTVKNFYKICKSEYKKNYTTNNIVLDKKTNSIAFLKMKNSLEGFFIEHPKAIARNESAMTCIYYYFKILDDLCKAYELFSFTLPIKYIFGTHEQRLHESILPFLPKLVDEKIYYCSSNNNDSIDIYCYDLNNKSVTKKTNSKLNEIFFSPIKVDNCIFYGTNLKSNFDRAELTISKFLLN